MPLPTAAKMPPKKKAKRDAPWAAINARKKLFAERKAAKQAQAAEAAARGEAPVPRRASATKRAHAQAAAASTSSSPLKNPTTPKKTRVPFLTEHSVLYGVGTDDASAQQDMQMTRDRLAAEAGARALQQLSVDPSVTNMPLEMAEAFGRQAERRAGTFQPWSFLGSRSEDDAEPGEAAGSRTDYPSGTGESAISMSGFSPLEHSPSSVPFGGAHALSMTPSTLQGWTDVDPLYGRKPVIHVNPHHGPTLRMAGATEMGRSRHAPGSIDFSSLDPRFYSPEPTTYPDSAGEKVGSMHDADTMINKGSRSFDVGSMHDIGCHPPDMSSMPEMGSTNDIDSMPATSSQPEAMGSMHNRGSRPYEMGNMYGMGSTHAMGSMYAMGSTHGMGTHGMGTHGMGSMHGTDALSYSQSAAPVFGGLSQFNDSPPSGLPENFTSQFSTEFAYAQGDSPMAGLLLDADGDADEQDAADEKHTSEGYAKHQRGESREVTADSPQRISSSSGPPRRRTDDPSLSSNNRPPTKDLRVDGRDSNIGSLPNQYSMSRVPLSKGFIDEIYYIRELFGGIEDDRPEPGMKSTKRL